VPINAQKPKNNLESFFLLLGTNSTKRVTALLER
jgi:hypothetical protein